MRMTLKREHGTDGVTFGNLFINGEFICYTLEDQERSLKVMGDTAIPIGLYHVDITMSPHFHIPLPLLINVPNYEGVRIHPGNCTADTEGCILVGDVPDRAAKWLGASRSAFNRLFPMISDAINSGDTVDIEIV